MMRPQPAKRQRCRSSRRYCEEKLCCPELHSEAVYYCQDCKSAQCQECEKDIHSRKFAFDFHDRRIIEPPSPIQLCQADKVGIKCTNRNYGDVWCENCSISFCYDCYSEYHNTQKNRKLHTNISLAHHERREREKYVLPCSSQGVTNIKPTSPLSCFDDTLTYYSFPQAAQAAVLEPVGEMSFSSAHSDNSNQSMPDLLGPDHVDQLARDLSDACLDEDINGESSPRRLVSGVCSFLLMNETERIQISFPHCQFWVQDESEFFERLGCQKEAQVKVVSIFGNTGDGKSHTLNHTFFNGQEVFKTSSCQDSCTIGVWVAFDSQNNVIVVDTEGLLGSSDNDNRRTRLLLKVLATSDVVVFRTRAERLHGDMFVFLSNASKAYKKHFSQELHAASQRFRIKESNLGPILIVFQETTHTEPLRGEKNRRADAVLRDLFAKKNYPVDAFTDLCYIGTKTVTPPTDFSIFRKFLLTKLRDNSVRAARSPAVMFQSLKALNEKFSGEIETIQLNTFPEKYFTCTALCIACRSKCTRTMNHDTEREPHDAGRDVQCQFHNQLGNRVSFCKKCAMNGRKNYVVPKTSASADSSWIGLTRYVWSGYVLECTTCGVIYRSREHWFGNQEPESVVQFEVRHVWPQGNRELQGTHNAGRKVLDSLHYMADTIGSLSAGPTKVLAEWTADRIAPAYWIPNFQITHCRNCELVFTTNEQKHHCRACGHGFCDECSSKKKPVPERGWGQDPVRVCDECFAEQETRPVEEPVTARKVGEVVSSTFGVLASALDYPLGVLKDSARPAYWVPDDQISSCVICEKEFGPKQAIHHCRSCGQGVCDECSQGRRAVPMRGWDYPVRVCSRCEKKEEL